MDYDIFYFSFTNQELPKVVPLLLKTFINQAEYLDQDDGPYNLSTFGRRDFLGI